MSITCPTCRSAHVVTRDVGKKTYPSRKHTYPARERAGMIVSTLIYADTYTP